MRMKVVMPCRLKALILIPAALAGPAMSTLWMFLAFPGAGSASTSMLDEFAARTYKKL